MMSFRGAGSSGVPDHWFVGNRQYNVRYPGIREGLVRWPVWRVTVIERSMEPVLRPGDWLLAWRSFGSFGSFGRARIGDRNGRRDRGVKVAPGQIVIARHPASPEMLLVKRAAWLEPDGWWLTSDNPGAGAVDSFRFGPVQPGLIEGRVLCRYWPPRR